MTEKSTIIVKPSAARQFESFWERGKVLFFSAPCGIGKMALEDTLLEGYPVLRLCGKNGFSGRKFQRDQGKPAQASECPAR